MFRCLLIWAVLSVWTLGSLPELRADEPSPVTAIDILLEPGEAMVARATAANARLRASYPQGFSLDDSHHPHISCLQRFVRTADLEEVFVAVGKVAAAEDPSAWTLKASKYFYVTWDGVGLAGIVVEPTDELIKFQRKLIDAVAPFTVRAGTAAAFVTTKQAPGINRPTIDYVTTYVPNETGTRFSPHVTIGLASPAFLDTLLAEQFEEFTFAPVGVAVYQLGNYGTARKELKSWKAAP